MNKTEDFIQKVLQKFPDNFEKYSYSKVQYIRTHDKVIITCKRCGDFLQSPAKHLSGRGCPKCKSLLLEDIIKLAEAKGYHLINNNSLYCRDYLELRCKVCGASTRKELRNLKESKGCVKCQHDRLRKDTEYFLSKVPLNPNYDYTKSLYTGANSKIEVECKKHGIFETTPSHLYKGKGCKSCGLERLSPFNETIAEKNKVIFSQTQSGFYILKLGDFYKIGIAKNLQPRINKISKQSGICAEVLSYIQSDQYSCIKLEQSLLSQLPLAVFSDEEKFDGYTECFEAEDDFVSDLIEYVEYHLKRR